MNLPQHQYIERGTNRIVTERLYADAMLNVLYAQAYEYAPVLYRMLISARMSSILSFFNFKLSLPLTPSRIYHFIKNAGIDLSECLDPAASLNTPQKIFERKIRYWETRPMPEDPYAIVSPADAKMLALSCNGASPLFIKNKFFEFPELLGYHKRQWHAAFDAGDAAIFRLTPDNYHYNHTPVSGRVVDYYEIPGSYNPVNPGTTITLATPYSKNKRVVTVIDTDVPGGTQAGLVAMIEIVALMIGEIVQCYSTTRYDNPMAIQCGMMLLKGQPKSLYRPGSSTDIILFQKDRISFSDDIIRNMYHTTATSRFSAGFGRPLVETAVLVRSEIGMARKR
ncbi:MAG: phosphatidylserine decarboxylase [Desulfobacterota bacterium]|nr:phosphatidylserine decarboxylase [Thermodesulfobacteriota bacterium]